MAILALGEIVFGNLILYVVALMFNFTVIIGDKMSAKIAQSAAHLTLVRKVVSSSPTASRLTQPSTPPWVCKMST